MKINLYFIAFACSIIGIQSCSKDDSTISPIEDENIKIKSAVAELGFDTAGIVIKGEDIFVEEDIVLKKSHLFKALPRQAVIAENNLIGTNSYKLKSFKYCISTTLTHHSPVEDAMDEFRSFLSGFVTLTRVFNEADADLVIRGYTEYSSTCGYAVWPTIVIPIPIGTSKALLVGDSININLYQWANLSNSKRKALIAHEVGHAIGIRHTNWRLYSELEYFPSPGGYYTTYGAYTVPNTNNTSLDPDPNSIFNARNCGRTWSSGFTQNDKRAIAYVALGLTL